MGTLITSRWLDIFFLLFEFLIVTFFIFFFYTLYVLFNLFSSLIIFLKSVTATQHLLCFFLVLLFSLFFLRIKKKQFAVLKICMKKNIQKFRFSITNQSQSFIISPTSWRHSTPLFNISTNEKVKTKKESMLHIN